jgi:hypothetical protein
MLLLRHLSRHLLLLPFPLSQLLFGSFNLCLQLLLLLLQLLQLLACCGVLCLLLLQLLVEVLEVLLCGGAAVLVPADGSYQALCLLLQRLQGADHADRQLNPKTPPTEPS